MENAKKECKRSMSEVKRVQAQAMLKRQQLRLSQHSRESLQTPTKIKPSQTPARHSQIPENQVTNAAN